MVHRLYSTENQLTKGDRKMRLRRNDKGEYEEVNEIHVTPELLILSKLEHIEEELQLIHKANYEARLKADMTVMLEEIESMFWELTKNKYDMQILYEKADDFEADFNSFIQQKINSLKETRDATDRC